MCTCTDLRRRAHRAAARIHDHLLRPNQPNLTAQLPQERWDEVRRIAERLRLVLARGWFVAAQHVLEDVDYTLRILRRELENFQTDLPAAVRPQGVAVPREMAADLIALEQEFEQVTIDLEEEKISVLTDALILEGVYLGPFRIVLHWNRIGRSHPYEIIAEAACAAESDRGVTHPHVRDQILCEGDGAAPIRSALTQGRLLDFFVLVQQILQNYNGGSAHVSLDDWDGVSCHECGYSMPRDEGGSCDRCGETLCSECSVICSGCECYLCGDCASQCDACQQSYCAPCLTVQPGTSRLLCSSCLQQEEESDDQVQDPTPEPTEPSPATPPEPAAPAADALCLGEAAAPPRPRRNRSRGVRRVSTRRPAARRRRTTRAATVLAGDS